jgi:hypothetical protein
MLVFKKKCKIYWFPLTMIMQDSSKKIVLAPSFVFRLKALINPNMNLLV